MSMCDLNRVQLGDLLDYEQPTRYIVSSTDYDDTYDTPVLTAGQTFILGYTNETKGIYKASKSNPVIIFDDFVTSFYLVDFDFKVKSSALKILKPKKGVNIYYVYYAMLGINFVPKEHARHWISKYSLFEISYPSLAKQQEIVSHLDTFTTLISNLENELDMRRKQYEHYRNQLLDFEAVEGIEWKTLGENVQVLRGRRLTKSDLLQEGKYQVFHGGLEPLGYYNLNNREADSVMIINVGASAGTVGYCNKDFWSSDGCFTLSKNPLLLPKYLYCYLKQQERKISSKVRKAGIPTLDAKVIEDINIPLIPLSKQTEIVSKLDTFENLIQSLEQEIKLRKQQYEYYREKLLTFE